jgi:hypothetical protein
MLHKEVEYFIYEQKAEVCPEVVHHHIDCDRRIALLKKGQSRRQVAALLSSLGLK